MKNFDDEADNEYGTTEVEDTDSDVISSDEEEIEDGM